MLRALLAHLRYIWGVGLLEEAWHPTLLTPFLEAWASDPATPQRELLLAVVTILSAVVVRTMGGSRRNDEANWPIQSESTHHRWPWARRQAIALSLWKTRPPAQLYVPFRHVGNRGGCIAGGDVRGVAHQPQCLQSEDEGGHAVPGTTTVVVHAGSMQSCVAPPLRIIHTCREPTAAATLATAKRAATTAATSTNETTTVAATLANHVALR